MSDHLTGERSLKKATEISHRTVLYSHECPYCGDPCNDYDVSVAGQEMECICGEKYEVVKRGGKKEPIHHITRNGCSICGTDALHCSFWSTYRNPKRESIKEGDALPGTEIFPEGLIAVPLSQLKNIYERFKHLIKLGQSTTKEWETMPKEMQDLKLKVFGEADFGAILAGNWLQQKRAATTKTEGEKP